MNHAIIRPSTWIAGVITLMALGASVLALFMFAQGRVEISIGIALLAFILDALDGWVARTWKGESKFGTYFDSTTDVVLYLFYPVMVWYWFFHLTQPVSVAILILFISCGIFRLVRFAIRGYVKTEPTSTKLAYPGLPVVFSIFLLLIFWFIYQPLGRWFVVVADTLLMMVSVLMIMKFPFPKSRQPWRLVVPLLGFAMYFLLYAHAY